MIFWSSSLVHEPFTIPGRILLYLEKHCKGVLSTKWLAIAFQHL